MGQELGQRHLHACSMGSWVGSMADRHDRHANLWLAVDVDLEVHSPIYQLRAGLYSMSDDWEGSLAFLALRGEELSCFLSLGG